MKKRCCYKKRKVQSDYFQKATFPLLKEYNSSVCQRNRITFELDFASSHKLINYAGFWNPKTTNYSLVPGIILLTIDKQKKNFRGWNFISAECNTDENYMIHSIRFQLKIFLTRRWTRSWGSDERSTYTYVFSGENFSRFKKFRSKFPSVGYRTRFHLKIHATFALIPNYSLVRIPPPWAPSLPSSLLSSQYVGWWL